MSWSAALECTACKHDVQDWNYTHNTSPMIYEALTVGRLIGDPPPLREAQRWWGVLNGMPAKEGSKFLARIIRGLVSDPAKFKAMNPANGWGDYDGLLNTLREMRDASTGGPYVWRCSG